MKSFRFKSDRMNLVFRKLVAFYFQRFLGFCLHLPLLFTLTILMGLVTKNIGVSLGIHLLLGHEDPWRQAFGGLFLGFVVGECFLLGFVFDQRRGMGAIKGKLQQSQQPPKQRSIIIAFIMYSSMILFSFVLTFNFFDAAFRFLKLVTRMNAPRNLTGYAQNAIPDITTHKEALWVAFFCGVTVALGVTCSIAWLAGQHGVSRLIEGWNVKVVRRWVEHLREKGIMRPGAEVSTRLVQVSITPIMLAVIVNVLFWTCRWAQRPYSPAVTSMYVSYMALFAYGLLHYIHLRLLPVVIIILLIGLAIGGLPTHKYRLPGMNELYKTTRMGPPYKFTDYNNPQKGIDPKVQPERNSTDQITNKYNLLEIGDVKFLTDQEAAEKRRIPMVVVVASGGGLRSAAWTYSILERLEKDFRDLEQGAANEPSPVNFPRHVRVIGGASGGMLGAAYYTATLPEPKSMETAWRNGTRPTTMISQYNNLTKDCLTSIVDCMLLSDLPAIFSPFPQLEDRGFELEKVWANNMENILSVPFSSLRSREASGWCPSLVFSPMMIEDGRRLLISNLDLDPVVRNAGNELQSQKSTYSREAVNWPAPHFLVQG